MIKLRDFIERAQRKPVLGLIVLLVLVALLALVLLHPALDAVELAVSCLTILAMAILVVLVLEPSRHITSTVPLALSRARPPTARPVSPVSRLLVPLRL